MGEDILIREFIELGGIGLLTLIVILVARHLYHRLWDLEKKYTEEVKVSSKAQAELGSVKQDVKELGGKLDECLVARGELKAELAHTERENDHLRQRVTDLEQLARRSNT